MLASTTVNMTELSPTSEQVNWSDLPDSIETPQLSLHFPIHISGGDGRIATSIQVDGGIL